jgi:Flp pilus assembly protein CpaB
VAGAVFLGVGLLGTAVGWSRLAAGEPVLVATRALAAGERIGPEDVAAARVRVADRDLAAAWVPAGERDRVVGQALAAPAQARQPLVRAQLGGRPLPGPDQVAFAVPVGPDTAAGGQVRPGDTVAVYVSWGRGQADAPAPAQAQELLPAVAVVDVGYAGGGGVLGGPGVAGPPAAVAAATGRGGAGRAPAWLTLAVSREQATALARARSGGELYVALVPPGAAPPATAGDAPPAPAPGAPAGSAGRAAPAAVPRQ